jgi:hypothetical protein
MTDFDLSRIEWRKSSRSGGNGGNCVEIAPARRPSSHGGSTGGDCVEVASVERVIAVRDSKNPDGPVLVFASHAWRAFTTSFKADPPAHS